MGKWRLLLDMKDGSNNMNEEWFGICAKGPTNERGLIYIISTCCILFFKRSTSIKSL